MKLTKTSKEKEIIFQLKSEGVNNKKVILTFKL